MRERTISKHALDKPDPRKITDEEEADIQAQIDDENPELTDEDFARMRPAKEVLPPELFAQLAKSKSSWAK